MSTLPAHPTGLALRTAPLPGLGPAPYTCPVTCPCLLLPDGVPRLLRCWLQGPGSAPGCRCGGRSRGSERARTQPAGAGQTPDITAPLPLQPGVSLKIMGPPPPRLSRACISTRARKTGSLCYTFHEACCFVFSGAVGFSAGQPGLVPAPTEERVSAPGTRRFSCDQVPIPTLLNASLPVTHQGG